MPERECHMCPVAAVAGLLSDVWTMRIIHSVLGMKQVRFCELERGLPGISTRTLTLKLKTLEEKGIFEKTDGGYVATVLGKKLKPVIAAMKKFGEAI